MRIRIDNRKGERREKERRKTESLPTEKGANADLLIIRSESAAQRSGRNSRGCFHAFDAVGDVSQHDIQIQQLPLQGKEERGNRN